MNIKLMYFDISTITLKMEERLIVRPWLSKVQVVIPRRNEYPLKYPI